MEGSECQRTSTYEAVSPPKHLTLTLTLGHKNTLILFVPLPLPATLTLTRWSYRASLAQP